jgi:hypothetical protein
MNTPFSRTHRTASAFASTWSGHRVGLHKGELWRLGEDMRGLGIQCAEGALWVTQQGDPRDYVLGPGEQFVITRHGVVVVQAIRESHLRIAPPLETDATPVAAQGMRIG